MIKYQVYDKENKEYVKSHVLLSPEGLLYSIESRGVMSILSKKRYDLMFHLGQYDINGVPVFQGDTLEGEYANHLPEHPEYKIIKFEVKVVLDMGELKINHPDKRQGFNFVPTISQCKKIKSKYD